MERPLAVAARNLGYRHPSGRVGVRELSLEVRSGERVVVMGPNGSGKSTLLRLLSTELIPTAGSLRLLGGTGRRPAALRRRIGVAGDRPVHLDALPGRDNALVFARAAGLPAPVAADRVDELLAAFHLSPVAGVPAEDYSMGMRRKLLLAETLAPDRDLLLLDEPTLGLDPPAVDALVGLLARAAAGGAAVVVATNDVATAPRLAGRVVFLDEGKVVADAPPGELLAGVGRGTTVEFELEEGVDTEGLLGSLPGASVEATGAGIVALLPGGPQGIPVVVEALVRRGARIRRMEVREPHLGDAFRLLTGRPLPEPLPERLPERLPGHPGDAKGVR